MNEPSKKETSRREGYCDDAAKCSNAGIRCDACTRNWFHEEPCDEFSEIEDDDR